MVVDEDLTCSFRILKPADKANFSFGEQGSSSSSPNNSRSQTPPTSARATAIAEHEREPEQTAVQR